MADKKISELDEITGANTAATDVFVVVDTSTGQTKKITREELNNAIEQDVLSSIDIDTINGDFSVNGNINLGDNNKAIFGAGSDLQIYHDGSNSYVKDAGTGNLNIQGNHLSLEDSTGTRFLLGLQGGETRIYNQGNERLAATNTGIDVTGTVTASDGFSMGNGDQVSSTGNMYIDVDSNNDSTNAALLITSDGKTNNRATFYENGDISFYEDTGTTAKLFWDASAEALGIGTTSPEGTLHVENVSNNSLIMDAPANRFNSIGFQTAGVDKWWLGRADSDQIAGDAFFIGIDNGNVTDAGGLSNKLVITQSGNVGIGTTSPASLVTGGNSPVLTIGGTDSALVTGDKSGAISFITNDGSYTGTYSDGITGEIASVSDSAVGGAYGLAFYTGTTTGSNRGERMRIDSSGRVGIGTSSPVRNLDINSSDSNSRVRFTNTSTGTGNGTDGLELGMEGLNAIFWSRENGILRFATNNTERMRIDSSGNLLVGKSSSSLGTAGFEFFSTGVQWATAANTRPLLLNRTASDGTIAEFRKDGTTVGSIGSAIGNAYFAGSSTGITFGSANIYPTNASGTKSDGTLSLGSSSNRFDDIFATNGTIQTSDANEKQDIEALSEAEQRVAVAAKGLLRKFRWIDSVEEKGDDARIHFGIIAQDLQSAFEAEGLDAGRYAMFINSTWTDEETGEERSRMGVRYNQLLAFIIAAI